MILSVEVITDDGDSLVFPIDDSSEGYVVRDIEGLDPVKANIIFSKFASLAGSQFQNAQEENRNIVLKLGYELNHPDTVSARRSKLYQFFMSGTPVRLRFVSDDKPTVEIAGYIETCVAPVFVQDPQTDVSILCLDPPFRSVDTTLFNGMTTAIPESYSINYGGTQKSGFVFEMLLDRDITGGFTITHNRSNGFGSDFVFNGNLLSGDLIRINTHDKEKGMWATRDGDEISLMYAVSPASEWLKMYKGQNAFRVLLPGDPIAYSLEYREKFGGL